MNNRQYFVWFDGLVHSHDGYVGTPPQIGSRIIFKEIDYRVRDVVYQLDQVYNYVEYTCFDVRVVLEQI